MIHGFRGTIAAGLLVWAPTLYGQSTSSASDSAGFSAIILTPIGALPQLVLSRRATDSSSRAAVAVRYGQYHFSSGSFGTFSNLGISAMVKIGRRVAVAATAGQRTCATCEGLKMGSLDITAALFHKAASGDIGGDTDIGLQLSGGLGKANTSDITARTISVSTPVAVSLPQAENSVLTLFVAPGLVHGSLTTNGAALGAAHFMASAGVGYAFAFGLGAHASVHRIAFEDSPTQFGFALSWRFGAH